MTTNYRLHVRVVPSCPTHCCADQSCRNQSWPSPKLAQPKVGPIQSCPSPKLSLLLWLCQFVRCPFWQCFFSRLISAPFLVSYRPDNTSAYLQDAWLPSCNLKFRLQGLFYIRIIKFIVGTTMGQANYGWDNIRPGQL